MYKWITLFRGINVGGKNILPMKELVRDLQSLNLENIKTYIQSGNVVFETPQEDYDTLGSEIAAVIEAQYGFKPQVLILSLEQLEDAIASNPFPEAESKRLHLFFLSSTPIEPNIKAINEAKALNERFHLTEHVFYLHAPDGIGRSKLAANAEKFLGVAATARNWRTVQKLWEIAKFT